MIFYREIIVELRKWVNKVNRKPLILRGARQVGKTTIINQLAKDFKYYVYLNLEIGRDRKYFAEFEEVENVVQAIFFDNNIPANADQVLIFIDEIQTEAKAVAMMRYFYELFPNLHIIAAGSLLETLLEVKNTFPVGRVEYLVLRPVSFLEFLNAIGEINAFEFIQKVPLPVFAHEKTLRLFHIYALIGGMPEIVRNYAKNRDFVQLKSIYESLLTAYLDDVQKYADTDLRIELIRHAIQNIFLEGANRIKFAGFANSNYRSDQMSAALRTLEKAMLIHLVYPSTENQLPAIPNLRKSPYLQTLDTGLMNFFSGLQADLIGTKDLHESYRGRVIHHLTGQMLLTRMHSPLDKLRFWVRDKKQSSAEVDFIYLFKSKLIPMEIKSGKTGKMYSLRQYMETANHDLSVRVYAGKLYLQTLTNPSGRIFYLLNLPYFLVEMLPEYLVWMQKEIDNKLTSDFLDTNQ